MESNKMRSNAFVTIIKDSQEARAFFSFFSLHLCIGQYQ